MIFIFEGVTKM